MPQPPKNVNYNKLVYQAEKTKKTYKKSEVNAFQTWQKKLGRKAAKLDKLDTGLRKMHKLLDEMDEAEERREEQKKALTRFMRMLEGAHKELQAYQSVPVGAKLPPVPKSAIGVTSISAVVFGMIVYLGAVKAYMALSEAISKRGG